jgi:hypothetical protein
MFATSDSTDVTASVTGIFLQFGVLGAFALLALWFFFTVYRREVERADRAEAALAALNSDLREKVMPALLDSVRVNTELQQLLREKRQW